MNIFSSGSFDSYKKLNIKEFTRKSFSLESFNEAVEFSDSQRKTTVFISHKHEDLEDLQGIIGFLEEKYNVDTYTDGNDSKMPKITNEQTAKRIRQIIKRCDKFILLATNKAVVSNWCNWELGFGDANKYPKDIAIFPINDKSLSENEYKGKEYMKIYPTIVYCNGTEKYSDGTYVQSGYYVKTETTSGCKIEKLSNWLS